MRQEELKEVTRGGHNMVENCSIENILTNARPLKNILYESLSQTLSEYIRSYFDEHENLNDFKGVRNKTGLHLISSDESRGYALIGFTNKLDRFYDDYKTRMEEARDLYSSLSIDIIREFVDYEKELLGFSWRKI